MFSAETYQQRRNELLKKGSLNGLIVIFGNEESPMNYEHNTYPFRQDSNFLYFAGIDTPHHFCLIDVAANEHILCGNELSIDHIVWMGNQPSMDEKVVATGMHKWCSFQEGLEKLKAAHSKGTPVHYLPPYRADRVELLSNCLGQSVAEIRSSFSATLTRAVIALRSIKEPQEITEMQLAVNITHAMHTAAIQTASAGQLESEVAGIVEGIAIGGGGRLAYPCIGTINGQILHNHHHHHTLEEGQLFLLDAGASSPSQYAGDITRTFPVSKSFTSKQKEVYQIVLDAQVKVIEQLKPGISFLDMH